MAKELKSNYIEVGNPIIRVLDFKPKKPIGNALIKNATIAFNDDNTAEISGEKLEFSFEMYKTFLSELTYEPDEDFVKIGYRNIINFLLGKKEQYVSPGFVLRKETKPYKAVMSHWFVVM